MAPELTPYRYGHRRNCILRSLSYFPKLFWFIYFTNRWQLKGLRRVLMNLLSRFRPFKLARNLLAAFSGGLG